MVEDIDRLFDCGIASENTKEILKFLKDIYNIPFNNKSKWEKLLLEFFNNVTIVPFVIELSLNDNEDIYNIVKNSFFLNEYYSVYLSTDDIYKNLIKIHESMLNGVDIRQYLDYFFKINCNIKNFLVKVVDEEDSRFKNFSSCILPRYAEIKKKDGTIIYEKIYLMLPDSSLDYPREKWCNKISKDFKLKLESKNNKTNKVRKRDPIESRLRHEVFKRDNYKCKECGKSKVETTLHVDHIIPVSCGGTDELDNLQTLCQACNLAKSNKTWISK